MPSSYRTNQFFGVENAGENGGRLDVNNQWLVNGANNPPFIYPAREIITQDGTGRISKTRMARGYIRTLQESNSGITTPIRKCGFQFNPQYLSTSVQMMSDVLNSFQQDIGQFAVPLAANSNFLFQLFFDRSMELNNNTGALRGQALAAPDVDETNIFAGQDALDPSQIGVFRDIGELNAIIGAGLSPDLKDYAQQVAKSQIQAEFNSTEDGDAAALDAALGAVSSRVSDLNYGNSAFLLPQPVRVVFSSLFMVEGFVTNVDINYTKFTHTMVPMQATVTLTMNALYIGYAKKRTYVTHSLEEGVKAFQEQQQAIVDEYDAFVSALQSAGGKASVLVNTDGSLSSSMDWGGVFEGPGNRLIATNFPLSLSDVRTASQKYNPGNVFASSYENSSDPSGAFYGTTRVDLRIYGSFPTQPYQSDSRPLTPGGPLIYSGSFYNTYVTWEDMAVGAAQSSPSTVFDYDNSIYYNKWQIIEIKVTSTVKLDGKEATGTGTYIFTANDLFLGSPGNPPNPTQPATRTVTMTWTGTNPPVISTPTTTSSSTAPSVTTKNASTAPPAPGAVSSVGKS